MTDKTATEAAPVTFKTSQAKAVTGAIAGAIGLGFGTFLASVMTAGSVTRIPEVTWWVIAGATITGSGLVHLAVWAMPNRVNGTNLDQAVVDQAEPVGIPAPVSATAVQAVAAPAASVTAAPVDSQAVLFPVSATVESTPIYSSLEQK